MAEYITEYPHYFTRCWCSIYVRLVCNPVWEEWDWSNESCEQIVVISAVAREMIKWAEKDDWQAVTRMLAEVEYAFTKGSDALVAYLGTDFTVTVMEGKNDRVKGHIKRLMGERTLTAYQ